MKPKVFDKKLSLKKQTVTHLNDGEQNEARGGAIIASGDSCFRPCDTLYVTHCGNTCCGSIDACSC